jgi:hypothetical protein
LWKGWGKKGKGRGGRGRGLQAIDEDEVLEAIHEDEADFESIEDEEADSFKDQVKDLGWTLKDALHNMLNMN